jgi:hypothetical protein
MDANKLSAARRVSNHEFRKWDWDCQINGCQDANQIHSACHQAESEMAEQNHCQPRSPGFDNAQG